MQIDGLAESSGLPDFTLAERWPDGRPIPKWMPSLIRAFARGVQNPLLQKSPPSGEACPEGASPSVSATPPERGS